MTMPRFVLALFLLLRVADTVAASVDGVGVKKLQVSDPVDRQPIEAVVFFPSPGQTGITRIGPYQVAASRSAAIGTGRYPVLVLSHGTMGSMWGHHDLASALASRGFIVVSLTHPGDNFLDGSRVGTVGGLYDRPRQASAALTAALSDPVLASHVDPDRIGFIGFSAGGTTGLMEAGASPDPARLVDYCVNRPADLHVCEGGGMLKRSVSNPPLSPDKRFRAFVLMAPLSVLFPARELKRIHAPMLVYVGEKDEELLPDDNAIALARAIPERARLETVPNASHFTFLAPCSAALSAETPALCTDPPGMDRVALHRRINAEIASFFHGALKTHHP